MQRFYSQSTQVTYLEGFHKVMPADAKAIDEDRYLAVLANPEPGKVRSHDADGLPILIDPPPADLAADERAWRDAEITRIQWIRERYRDEQDLARPTSITADQFADLLDYLQQLRDWPAAPDFPDKLSRPKSPDWIAFQVQ